MNTIAKKLLNIFCLGCCAGCCLAVGVIASRNNDLPRVALAAIGLLYSVYRWWTE